MATWIKCTHTKREVVYVNLDNAVTVTRNDVADRVAERGTVISFMGGEQLCIVVNEQPEEIIKIEAIADRTSS
jgi:formate-dependent phosphoribosylglycinamide formyltransferase (GAR transformylase)